MDVKIPKTTQKCTKLSEFVRIESIQNPEIETTTTRNKKIFPITNTVLQS